MSKPGADRAEPKATMTGVIATIPRIQFSNALGLPLAGGKLTTYLAGTTTPEPTYQDQALTIQNEATITLDSTGSCVLWLDPAKSYKFLLKSALGVTQPGWPVDNINGAANLTSLEPTLGLFTRLTALAANTGAALVGFLQSGVGAIKRTVQDKLRESVSVKDFGAKGDNATDDTTAFQAAINASRNCRLHVPAGTYLLSASLAATLAASEDFVLVGEGAEVSRLRFVVGGLSVTYSGDGRSFGDASAIRVEGIGLETEGQGIADALRIVNTATTVVNDVEGHVTLDDLTISGVNSATSWVNAIYLENVAFPDIRRIKVEDGGRRTVALSIATTGTYAAVDTTVDSFKCWEVATAIKVRGRSEGVYLNHFIVIGGETGIDWVATLPAGAGKKPLLLLDNSHINVAGTAVKTTDVAQVLAADSLIYLTNSPSKETYAFDFQATTANSSENSRINGVTIIGQGDRTGSRAVGVRCGANVFGVAVDATMDNVGTCVETVDINRTTIAPSARLSNYNTRSIGMYSAGGVSGGMSGGVSVDGSLQLEENGATNYARDLYREQLRTGSFTFVANAASEIINHPLTLPFRNDTAVLLATWGADPGPGGLLFPDLVASTGAAIVFKTAGLTAGATYRINYIAYGY